MIVEGGCVREIFLPVPDDKCGTPFTAVDYDLVDYDIFEGTPDKEIAEYWEKREPETKAYFRKHLPDEFHKFHGRSPQTRHAQKEGRLKEIIIEVARDGQTQITTKGFKGKACKDATAALEKALGAVKSDTPTREYHEHEELHNRSRA